MDELELPKDTTVFGNGFGAFVALGARHPARQALRPPDRRRHARRLPEPARVPFRGMAERVSKDGMAAVLDTAIGRMFPPAFAERIPIMIAARKAALAKVDPQCFARACLALASMDLTDKVAGDQEPNAGAVRRARPDHPACPRPRAGGKDSRCALRGNCRLGPLPRCWSNRTAWFRCPSASPDLLTVAGGDRAGSLPGRPAWPAASVAVLRHFVRHMLFAAVQVGRRVVAADPFQT